MEEGEDELSAEVAGLVGGAEVCTEPLGNWDAVGNGTTRYAHVLCTVLIHQLGLGYCLLNIIYNGIRFACSHPTTD